MAVSCGHPLMLAGAETRADRAALALDATSWQWYSYGGGANDHRFYYWASITLDDTEWALARRSNPDPSDLAFYRCLATRRVGLPELVRVAGSRWGVEVVELYRELFQTAKNEAATAEFVHTAWYRQVTLAVIVPAHLAFLAADPLHRPACG
ncbi:hypothetical protein [Actinoallomurus iriomotensis]|uniref:Uncharacterized protein n=1 Tax=Actinoallomurus iriomotensis TaxID=478107 RepID=A0A9W6RR60_9ACTN|nr:hypothetical protein [Actinoallomurus iriomotensis]GLY80084.1 hypothetical protein Airi01_083510 [Actinoallomurus iriomotensis]